MRFSAGPNYGVHFVNRGKKNEREIDLRNLQAPDGTPFTPAWSEEDYWQYQRRIRGDAPKRNLSQRKHPLRNGFVRCGKEGKVAMYATERKVRRAGGKIVAQLGYECQDRSIGQPRIKAEIVFKAIEEDLNGGFGLTDKEYHQFTIKARKFADAKRSQRKFKRKRITELTALAERDLEQLEAEKAALVRSGEYDADAKSRIEKRKKELKQELQNLKLERKAVDEEFENDLFTFKTFLELSLNAHQFWANANSQEKHKIAEIMILNLVVEGQKVRSITYKPPFDRWIKHRNIHYGRELCANLESLFEWLLDDIDKHRGQYQPKDYKGLLSQFKGYGNRIIFSL